MLGTLTPQSGPAKCKGDKMSKHEPYFNAVLELWNEFAIQNGYPPQKKISQKLKSKLLGRAYADKNFLRNLPATWALIHDRCKTNEFGSPLDFHQFIRSTVYLKALASQPSGDVK